MGVSNVNVGYPCGLGNGILKMSYDASTSIITYYTCCGKITFNSSIGYSSTDNMYVITDDQYDYLIGGLGACYNPYSKKEYLDEVNLVTRTSYIGYNESSVTHEDWTIIHQYYVEPYTNAGGYSGSGFGYKLVDLSYDQNLEGCLWGVDDMYVSNGLPQQMSIPTFDLSNDFTTDQSLPILTITSSEYGVNYWLIQRSTSEGGTYTTVETLYTSGSTREFLDTGATGNEYWYKIIAYNPLYSSESIEQQYLFSEYSFEVIEEDETGYIIIPSGYTHMDYLLVAGGGSGGSCKDNSTNPFGDGGVAGGGGAGGCLRGTEANPVAGTYPVTVGSGGGAVSNNSGNNGSNTTFYGFTATGGGKGGAEVISAGSIRTHYPCAGGGSGGAAGQRGASGGSGIAGQGNAGSDGNVGSTTYDMKLMGGGAGSGGAGYTSDISGNDYTYSAGGYSSTNSNYGNGGNAATGGNTSGAGSDGVVIIKVYNKAEIPPNAPTGGTSSSITCTGATISWVNNNTENVTGNTIYRLDGSVWTEIANVSSGTTSYVLDELTPYTDYVYAVSADNAFYNVFSDGITFQTLDPAPYDLTEASLGGTTVTITWDINDPPYGLGIRVELRELGETEWNIIETIDHDDTSYTFTGLDINTDYECRFVRLGSEYPSEILEFTTLNFYPPTDVTLDEAWVTRLEVSWTNEETYDALWIVIDDVETEITSTDTGYTFYYLNADTEYEIYLKVEKYGAVGESLPLYASTLPAPPSFCEDGDYEIVDATCGESDGSVSITNKLYMETYAFNLLSIDGTYYMFDSNYLNATYGEALNLPANYYKLVATPKSQFNAFYGGEVCESDYFKIEASDTTMSIDDKSIRDASCGTFGATSGRIVYFGSDSGTEGDYESILYDVNGEVVSTVTGTTIEQVIFVGFPAGHYYAVITNNNNYCVLLSDDSVKNINNFSVGGVKRIFVTEWTDDVEYNYWSAADEDYYVSGVDSDFFASIKIKEFIDSTLSANWFEIPLEGKSAQVGQVMNKTKQGFIFTDSMTITMAHADNDKWNTLTDFLDDKHIVVYQDNNNQYWCMGYRLGATVDSYQRSSNEYILTLNALSDNKIITNIDKDYVINNIIN